MVAEPGRPRVSERIGNVLVPLIMEEIVEVINAVPWERISERMYNVAPALSVAYSAPVTKMTVFPTAIVPIAVLPVASATVLPTTYGALPTTWRPHRHRRSSAQ